jgi:uracil-DNA glycosylase
MENLLSNIPSDWKNILLKKKLDKEVLSNILQQTDCTPPPELWFEWARLTPLDNIKVIIIGQDPYPTRGTAHGLAFSSLNTVPDSLRNVYKCLEHSKLIANHKQTTVCLSSWAEQGVLLLNTALSTEIGKRRAHFELWKEYVQRILVRILQYHIDSELIIMCWGRDAQNLIAKTITKARHKFHILEWCHPSPMTGDKFLSCDHFIVANNILRDIRKDPIDWSTIDSTKQKVSTSDAMAKQIIFTDGSAVSSSGKKSGNKKDANCVGGYAAVFVDGPIKGELLGNLDTSTYFASNIRAEGHAFISALSKCNQELTSPAQIELYTDSEFWIKMVQEYMPRWSKEKFTQKENSDMTQMLWKLWEEIHKKHKVVLHHVYSHNKSGLKDSANEADKFQYTNNELADQLANEARTKLKPGQEVWR